MPKEVLSPGKRDKVLLRRYFTEFEMASSRFTGERSMSMISRRLSFKMRRRSLLIRIGLLRTQVMTQKCKMLWKRH